VGERWGTVRGQLVVTDVERSGEYPDTEFAVLLHIVGRESEQYAFTYRPWGRDFVDFEVWPMDNVVSMVFEDLAEIIETSDLPRHPGEGRVSLDDL
jgi:hypothetical protein